MPLAMRWYGCDLVSGEIVEELPELRPTGVLERRIGDHTSCSFELPIPLGGNGAPPPAWRGATEPGRTMIVATLSERPVWAGMILTREGGTDATLKLGTATLEAYLDRRYIETHTFVGADESSSIANDLIGDANDVEGLEMIVDTPPTGQLRDRSYLATDDKSVLRALQELAAVENGFEWTIDLDWTDEDHTAFAKILRVRDRIGAAADPGTGPTAVFDTFAAGVFDAAGASDASYVYSELYDTDRGGNHIVAVSSGQGDIRPMSVPQRAEDLLAIGWPRWEQRFTPSTSITSTDTLNAHAAGRLIVVRDGARALTLKSRADVYPMLGDHWVLGDDVGYNVVGHRHPEGLSGVARAIGWRLDPQRNIVEPMLILPGEDE